jgi:hypothetical protein
MERGKMDSERTRHPEIFRQAAKLTLGVWLFTSVLFVMPIFAATGHLPRIEGIGLTFTCIGFGILMSLPLYWAAARLNDARPWAKVAGVFAAVCLCAFVFSLFDALAGGHVIKLFMAAHRIPPDVINRTVSNFISFSWLYGLLGTIYVILHTHAAMRDRELQLAEARGLAQTAQLTALRLQLNPHFLFNTLNAISSLIVTGRARQGEAMLASSASSCAPPSPPRRTAPTASARSWKRSRPISRSRRSASATASRSNSPRPRTSSTSPCRAFSSSPSSRMRSNMRSRRRASR